MIVPWKSLNGRQVTTTQCNKEVDQKRQQLAEEEIRESGARDFQAYGRPIETVQCFRYLGRVMTTLDENWTAVVGNLRKERKSWDQLTRILGREGSILRVPGILFMAVLHTVLLFGS